MPVRPERTLTNDVAALQAENERLHAYIDSIEDTFGLESDEVPYCLPLTPSERRVMGLMMRREACNKEQLLHAAHSTRWNADDLPELKIIDVWVCKMRRKLKPFGIHIVTLWGHGYRITPADKAKVKALLIEEMAA